MRTVAPFICPEGTTGTAYSYETTTVGDNGISVPATAYELDCVEIAGETVKNDPILYAFLWEGIATGGAASIMAVLASMLAAPAGVIVGGFLAKRGALANEPPDLA